MIVKMKKISLVVLERAREESLERLRKTGVMHLEERDANTEELSTLKEKRKNFERAMNILPQPDSGKADTERDPLETALKVIELSEHEISQREEIASLKRLAGKSAPWNGCDPRDIHLLRERGIDIRLYEISKGHYNKLDKSNTFIIKRRKASILLAYIHLAGSPEKKFPVDEIPLPELSLQEIEKRIAGIERDIENTKAAIADLAKYRHAIESSMGLIDKSIEFEKAKAGMGIEGEIAYLSGFVPENRVVRVRKAAMKNKWAILIREPSPGDKVPTLIENPKWLRIIEPVFKLLGTVPGYNEFDISLWFLIFFSVFFAMIVGDGGYGLVFFLITFISRKRFRTAPAEPFLLLYVMSVCTIIWGAITGTWFGVEYLSKSTVLSYLVIPGIASFSETVEGDTSGVIMHICFIIGAVHLTIAHIRLMLHKLPSLSAFAEAGWVSIIWGIYFLVKFLILREPLNPVALWAAGAGLAAVLIFSEQQGRPIRDILRGFSPINILIQALQAISSFSDVVSYVRLFAVGLATLAVAKSFNEMAIDIGFGLATGLLSALVLFFGHTLNILLACMSLIVHGVRLNMLEFSGHLSMEWSGIEYTPFREDEGKLENE